MMTTKEKETDKGERKIYLEEVIFKLLMCERRSDLWKVEHLNIGFDTCVS